MQRHLAAILSADIAGYSKLMHLDEVGTLSALKRIRAELVIPKTRQYHGRSIKLMGDGELMEFPSIVDAVSFAVEIQLAMIKRNAALAKNKQIWFRIGINIGDILVDDNDIYGDGVNLASRVENIADPGGICLTNMARSQIINQLSLEFRDLGHSQIKGFDKPINLFAVVLDEKAEALMTPINYTAFDADNIAGTYQGPVNWHFFQFKSAKQMIAAWAAALGFLYLATGSMQMFANQGRITPGSAFCPIVTLAAGKSTVVDIGVMTPLKETHGQRMKWGIERGLRDNRGLYNFGVNFDIGDTSGSTDEMLAILKHYEDEKVSAIIGPMQSEYAYHAKKWGNRTRTPIISPLASASYLTNRDEKDFFFRTTMSDSARAEALVDWLTTKGLHRNVYVLNEWMPRATNEDAPEIYGEQQASAVKQNLNGVTTIRFTRGDEASWTLAAEQVKNDGNAVLIFGYTSNIKEIIRKMQLNGVANPIFLMGVVTKSLEEASLPLPGNIFVVTPDVSEARTLSDSEQLQQVFEDDNPKLEFDLSAYYAYDTVTMLLDAIREARDQSCGGWTDGDLIAEKLRQTPNKLRKLFHTGFLQSRQEVYFQFDGLNMIDGKFEHVGLGR